MEKVEVVKRLIRSHNYRDVDRVYLRCLELGIHVNKTALFRFSEKLALIDRASRNSPTPQLAKQTNTKVTANEPQLGDLQSSASDSSTNISPIHLPLKTDTDTAVTTESESDSESGPSLSFAEAKRREAEITFELGALKIKEHALLEELNALSSIIDETH